MHAGNHLRFSLENFVEMDKTNIVNNMARNHSNQQISNQKAKNKIPSSAETVKLLMHIKNNESSEQIAANNHQTTQIFQRNDPLDSGERTSKYKETLRHSLENTKWILQKHQKNLSVNEKKANKCPPENRATPTANSNSKSNKINNTAKDRNISIPEETAEAVGYDIGGHNATNVMRSSFSGCREGLTQIMHRGNEGESS